MNENQQDKTKSKLITTEDRLWLPPFSPKDQKRLKHLQKKSLAEKIGLAGKTPWDFIQLLIIPLVLAGVGFWFSAQQNQTSLQVSERQHQADLQIAATRYANDQQLTADQQQEITLKTYLDDMSDLLLNHGLRKAKSGDEVSQVARERTLTTLRRLRADRNRIVLQFLQDAHLIGVKNAVIDLSDTDLSNDDLRLVNLFRVNLSHAQLNGTNLRGAILLGANLSHDGLNGANLRGAHLGGANLSYAQVCDADLSGADLFFADLSYSNLSGASLHGAVLAGADLSGAQLSDADLSGAYLSEATVTQVQLYEAKSLQGAVMPDGSKHP